MPPPNPDLTSSSEDLYALLGLDPTEPFSPSTLRKAYRKSSLLYHPDKNPSPDAAHKFHLLTLAYDVLADPASKTAYDNARRAREEVKVRHEQLDAKRRKLREELEGREREAMGRVDAERAFQRELERLKEQGARLRREREEALRKAREEEGEEEGEGEEAADVEGARSDGSVEGRETKPPVSRFSELDRTIRVRWRNKGAGRTLSSAELERIFRRFGKIVHCLVKDPKPTADDDGKEKKVRSGLVVFDSIVGAFAAVEDGGKLKDGDLKELKDVAWASGKAPEIPQLSTAGGKIELGAVPPQRVSTSPPPTFRAGPKPATASSSTTTRKAPSFGSFGKTASGTSSGSSSPYAKPGQAHGKDYESLTLLRMRQAEKRRLEEEILKKEQEEEEAV